MALVTAKDIKACEAPDDLFDSVIVQCLERDFGLSKSKQQPQIVSKWEILGVRTKDNKVDPELVRDGKTYVLAGLSLLPVYMSLSPRAIRFFQEFWEKATGKAKAEFSIDTENPDLSFMNKLAMSAVVKAVKLPKRKPLSDEQREELVSKGLPAEGEAVLDDDGNPVFSKFIQLDTWNKRFTGELPAF